MTGPFWYLWAAPHQGDFKAGRYVHALGPFATREEVDAKEWAFRRWAEDHIQGFHPWIVTGGVAYAEDKGPGKMNQHFQEGRQ